MRSPLEEMRIVARRLQPLDVPFVFVGGGVMCLLVDYPELTQFRPTKDVDVVVEVLTYGRFAKLEERLRRAGFQHDTSEGSPICRWMVDDCRVDIMPEDSAIHGMNTKWFAEALELAWDAGLGESCVAKVITAPLFLATKLEAFKDRGKGDYYASHDLEDMITLVDGRSNIAEEVAGSPREVRRFIANKFAEMLNNPDFNDALPGHLPSMQGSRERVPLVIERLYAISKL